MLVEREDPNSVRAGRLDKDSWHCDLQIWIHEHWQILSYFNRELASWLCALITLWIFPVGVQENRKESLRNSLGIRKPPFSSTEERSDGSLGWARSRRTERRRTLQGDRPKWSFWGGMWEGEATWEKEDEEPWAMPSLLTPGTEMVLVLRKGAQPLSRGRQCQVPSPTLVLEVSAGYSRESVWCTVQY